MPGDDWLDRAQSFVQAQQIRAAQEWSQAREKLASVTDKVAQRFARLVSLEQQKQAELAKLIDMPTSEPTTRRRQAIWIGSGLILLGGASYVLYTRYSHFGHRRRATFDQYAAPAPRQQQGGLLAALREPFSRVSSTISSFAFAPATAPSGLPPVTPCPSPSPISIDLNSFPASSSSSSSFHPAPPATPGLSIFHRTSRSISVAWESLAPKFGGAARKGARRLFSTLTRAGSPRKVKACVAYVELELQPGAIRFPLTSQAAALVIQQHMSVIDAALPHATEHLYVGLVTDTSALTIHELNELLGAYYNAIAALAYGKQHRKPIDYAFTLILPLPRPNQSATQLAEEVRSRVAMVADLSLRLFTSDEGEQAIRAREAVTAHLAAIREEKGLPIVRPVVIDMPAPTLPPSDPTAPAASERASVVRFQTYSDVVLGGTFDHLHAGHKIMLTVAALLSEKSLVIGLTADEMLASKKYRETLESWQARLQSVLHFLRLITPDLEVDLVPLHDMYGPSGDRAYLKALVVSEETAQGGAMVNLKRKENHLGELEVVVVHLARPPPEQASASAAATAAAPVALTADKISSTTLRKWEAEATERRANFLQEAWLTLCTSLKVRRELAEETLTMLQSRYSEPHRSYHTLAHVEALLKQSFELQSVGGVLTRPEEIELAIWFHDVIYETPTSVSAASAASPALHTPAPRGPGQNENDSAAAFQQFALQAGLDAKARERVARMIRATIQHQVPEELLAPTAPSGELQDLQYFLDFDLSILGATDGVYARYTASIRTEYIHLPYEQYLTGRLGIMQTFLQRPQLYFTEEYRTALESKARYNVRREIERIQAAPELQHHS